MPRGRLFAYLDDILWVVDPVIAEQALRVIVEEVGGCGLQSAAEKLKVWVPDGSPPPGGLRQACAPKASVS